LKYLLKFCISRADKNVKVIGLTGGIGSGKSTAARFLAELGAVVIDLDKVGHDALKKDSGAYQQVANEFGKDILFANGEIDRARLGKIVFNNPDALKRLNQIMHPAIDSEVKKITRDSRKKGIRVVVLEAAAMLEADKAWQVDEIWVTTASEKTVLNRLKERSGYAEAEAKARIHAQLTNKERIRQADVVINTDCTLDELKVRLEAEWEKLRGRISD
jgi:dephospho-CoA kinase